MNFVRGDYKELVILSLVYLNEAPEKFKTFQMHARISNARWMEKILYVLKIVLLSSQIQSLSMKKIELE